MGCCCWPPSQAERNPDLSHPRTSRNSTPASKNCAGNTNHYYQLAQLNQPLVPLPQFSGARPDAMKPWVANDLSEAFPQATLHWAVVCDGQMQLNGQQKLDVPATSAVAGDTIDLSSLTAKHPAFDLVLTVDDSKGRSLSCCRRTVRTVPEELLKPDKAPATADPFNQKK
jgi:hypothetical protein